ncbi:MAG: aspartate aminotransferase family protein [Acidimicrobiia bacterium]|nr:aspartate aminotransferase family protein [Acidimicrobiia bacterium]
MSIVGPKTAEWFDRAFSSLANGVSSGWRYWGRDETIVISRGEGAYLYDPDGKRYIDYHCGFGPVILGHADPTVTAAVAEAAASGITYAFTQEREVQAAETFKQAVPWVEQLRFTNTGTEATMHAVRLARGFTGRDIIVKFEGTYHGAHDYVMYSTPGDSIEGLGSPYRPIPTPMSSGMPHEIGSLILVLPFNDVDAVRRTFADHGNRIAALIVEPMLGNAMGIEADPGFLAELRAQCDATGSVLIFDEVKTGFRIAVGGAVEAYGVTPDLGTFAKAMGNGVPVAAIAGRGEVLEGWKRGGITHAGTYCGNSISTSAARATIERLLTGEPMQRVERAGTALMEGTSKILANRSVPHSVQGRPAMFGFFFGENPIHDYRATDAHDSQLYERLIMGMIRRGVMPSPEAYEPWFLCAALSDEDVATTLQVFEESLDEALA